MDVKNFIAGRVAKDLKNSDVVKSGVGLQTLVADPAPEGIPITLLIEHGILGEEPELCNAEGFPITFLSDSIFFDSAKPFAAIRSGNVDVTVLGTLQVDEEGNVASCMLPGKDVFGLGDAKDLVTGAKEVIVAMEHTINGKPKIMKKCTYPLTAIGVVKKIITEMGVMQITKEGIVLTELAPGISIEDIQAATDARLIIARDLLIMNLEKHYLNGLID